MESPIYSQEGKKVGMVTLPENIFGVRWNADLVKQVVDSLLSSKRKPVAHTKDRSEVRGGGKKPWQQKGTGRARHGSIRSPIWVGGGVTGGPRNEKNFQRKVSKKMRIKALYSILSKKLNEDEFIFIDQLTLPSIKTKLAKSVMDSLFDKASKKKNNAILLTIPKKDVNIEKSFRNFGNMKIDEVRNMNPLDLLKYKYVAVVDPTTSIKVLPGNQARKNGKQN